MEEVITPVSKKYSTTEMLSKFEEIQYRSELLYSKILALFFSIDDLATKTEIPEEIERIKQTLNDAKTDGNGLNIVLIYRETFNEMNSMPLPELSENEYNRLNNLYERWKSFYDTAKYEDVIEQGKTAVARLKFNYNKQETEDEIARFKEDIERIDSEILNYKNIKEIKEHILEIGERNSVSLFHSALSSDNTATLEEANKYINSFYEEYDKYKTRTAQINEKKEQISTRFKGLKQKLCNLVELVSLTANKDTKNEGSISPTLSDISKKLDAFEIWIEQLQVPTSPATIDILEALIKDKTETFNKLEEDITPLMNTIHKQFSPLIDKIREKAPTPTVEQKVPEESHVEPVEKVIPVPMTEIDPNSYYGQALISSKAVLKFAHSKTDPLRILYDDVLGKIKPEDFTKEDFETYSSLFHRLIESTWYDEEKKKRLLEEVEEFKNKFNKEPAQAVAK